MKNIIAAGESSVKIHVTNGPKTLCNKKSLNKEDKITFINSYKKYPGICCTTCAAILIRTGKIK